MSTSDHEPPAPTSLPNVDEPTPMTEIPAMSQSDDLPTDAEFAADEELAEGELSDEVDENVDGDVDAAVEAMDFDGEVPDAAEYYGYDEVYPWETDDEGPRVPPKRHKGGGGVMLGAAMLGLRDVLYGRPKEDTAIEIEASGDPPNVDLDGMDMEIDENRRAVGPPLDDIKARAVQNRRSRRRPPTN